MKVTTQDFAEALAEYDRAKAARLVAEARARDEDAAAKAIAALRAVGAADRSARCSRSRINSVEFAFFNASDLKK